MKILAIDTSTDYLSLAVLDNGKLLSRFHRKAHMSHSRLLVPAIDRILKKSRLKLKKIDYFCISIGPGSFTGLRIGVATVKGLAYVLKKPIAAVPTLDAVAQNAKYFNGIICPVLDAKKNKVYACVYKSDGDTIKRVSEYLLLSVGDLMKKVSKYNKILFLGDVIGKRENWPAFAFDKKTTRCFGGHIRRRLSSVNNKSHEGGWHPRADAVGRLGLEYIKKRKFTSAEDLEPLYLYSKECDITGR